MPFLRRDGATLRYVRCGTGPAVLLVQGAGVVGAGWRPQTAALQDRFTLVAFDNRGIGESTLDGRPLTIDAMAADALAIADAEGLERFHVVGHSMGGLIAQRLALDAPDRVLSLALLCTFLRGREAARLTPGILWTALRTRVGTRTMRRRAFTRLVMPDAYLDGIDRATLEAELSVLFGRDLAEQPAIVMQQVRAMARFDVSARLSELASIPTLVMTATLDRLALPAYGRGLSAAIPGATCIEIPDAGHGVTIQCADRVNDLLARHFMGVGPSAGRWIDRSARSEDRAPQVP